MIIDIRHKIMDEAIDKLAVIDAKFEDLDKRIEKVLSDIETLADQSGVLL